MNARTIGRPHRGVSRRDAARNRHARHDRLRRLPKNPGINFPKRPFIVAVTGYDLPVNRITADEAGFDLFLVKPVDSAKMLATLEEFKAGRRPDPGEAHVR